MDERVVTRPRLENVLWRINDTVKSYRASFVILRVTKVDWSYAITARIHGCRVGQVGIDAARRDEEDIANTWRCLAKKTHRVDPRYS